MKHFIAVLFSDFIYYLRISDRTAGNSHFGQVVKSPEKMCRPDAMQNGISDLHSEQTWV